MRLVRGRGVLLREPDRPRASARSRCTCSGYLFDPAHAAIVAEQARLRDERVARLRADDGEDGRRRLPRGRRVGVRAACPRHQRRTPAPGAGAGRGRRGRVGERGVRDAAAQRQPLLRAEGRHARRAGDRDGAGGRRRRGVRAPARPPSRPGRGAVRDRGPGRRRARRRRGRPPRPRAGGPRAPARARGRARPRRPPGPATTTARTRPPRSRRRRTDPDAFDALRRARTSGVDVLAG